MNRDESLELSATSSSYFSLDNIMDIESFNLTSEDLSIIVSDCSMSEEEMVEVKTGSSFSDKTDSVESVTIILKYLPVLITTWKYFNSN